MPRPGAVLFDLLMAVMDSPAVWSAAAGHEATGWAWRDAVTRRMMGSVAYVPYEQLVRDEAAGLRLPSRASDMLFRMWATMAPRPDAACLTRMALPYAFVTNCSASLAAAAASSAVAHAALRPEFVLSAEEAGRYKPQPAIYLEACRRLALRPARVLFVAGAPYDAVGARAAGLRATLVLRRPLAAEVAAGIRQVASLEDVVADFA